MENFKKSFMTVNDYSKIDQNIYEVIKSYTVYHINRLNMIKGKANILGGLYNNKVNYNNLGNFMYSTSNYAEEKANNSKFLFYNDAEKSIFINNIIYYDDEKFMDIILDSNSYDLLNNLVHELKRIDDKNEGKKAKDLMDQAFLSNYVRKNEKQVLDLKNRFVVMKGEFNLNNVINKFTEINVFNPELINKINGYEDENEEKVYSK